MRTQNFCKSLLVALTTVVTFTSFGQIDTLRHSLAFQIGGQTWVSIHHEYALINRKYFVLKTNLGAGLNEHADDTDPTDRPIYGVHSGFVGLIGPRLLAIELGLNPTTYFYKKTTFVNLNSWMGLRFTPKKTELLFISLGYSPRLYTTYSDANHHFLNAWFGFKLGLNLID